MVKQLLAYRRRRLEPEEVRTELKNLRNGHIPNSEKAKEVALTGTLTVRGETARAAHLVLKFPFSCRLEGDGGFALAVNGTPQKPVDNADSSAAGRLLQLACPLIAYKGLKADEADAALRTAAASLGADLNAPPALSRLVDRVVYVLGVGNGPQLWLYKDSHAPARMMTQGNDLRLLHQF